MASGINSTFRQVGIATGIAALGAIFTHVVNGAGGRVRRGGARAPGSTPRGARAGQFSDFISFGVFRQVGGGEAVALAGREAFLDGLHAILLYGGDRARLGGAVRGADPAVRLRRAGERSRRAGGRARIESRACAGLLRGAGGHSVRALAIR